MKNSKSYSFNYLILCAYVLLTGCISGGPLELENHHHSSNIINYKKIPFSEYMEKTKETIKEYNQLGRTDDEVKLISPFEIKSNGFEACEKNELTGVLLIHGLTDTPYLMRDLSNSIISSNKCMLVRSIVLPGHATVPGDLLHVRYDDWIGAAKYGVESFSDSGVTNIFIAGFSTGGALALDYVINSADIGKVKGLLLFSPAIRIKSKEGFVANWHNITSWYYPKKAWVDILEDKDFAKYESFPKNAADQIYLLTTEKIDTQSNEKLSSPLFVVLSQDDDTVDSDETRKFFDKRADDSSQLIIYKAQSKNADCAFSKANKICERTSLYADMNVNSFSHTAIPVSPANEHYGKNGSYKSCSHYLGKKEEYEACKSDDKEKFVLGEKSLYKNYFFFNSLPVRRLTFNPDYEYMTQLMNKFINTNRN